MIGTANTVNLVCETAVSGSPEIQEKLKGACRIDYAFFSNKGLKHGGGLSTTTSAYLMNDIYASFVYNNDVYMKSRPGYNHSWRDKATNEEKMFVMCVDGKLLEDGINDKVLYVTPEAR